MLRLDPDARRTPQHDPRILSRGCGEMFAAIIQQAFHDVFVLAGIEGQKELIRSEAISLLTSSTGEWAAHRRFLCDLIGLNSDVLRRHVHEILMGTLEPNLVMPGIERAGVEQFKQKQVDAARAVYQRQFNRPKTTKPKPVKAKPKTVQHPSIPAHKPTRPVFLDDWYANMTADA